MRAVWLHGAGMGPEMWDPAHAEGLRLDLPGHGSRPRAKEPTVAAMAEALLSDCPPRFDLIGHSLGGMIGLHLAATHPDRVRRLVVVDSFLRLGATALHRAALRLGCGLVSALPRGGLVALMGLVEFGQTRRIVRAAGARVDRAGLDDALAAAVAFDGRVLLARIAAPVLVLVGRRNPFSHAQGRAIARGVGDGRFAMLPGGHLLPLDDPDGFHAAVAAFRAEVA
jgi:pimeloyl-ACP methyl ester carboxylesterase